ncbi:mechanosensitive ion channel family protein [Paenibacillus sp. KQZ6P-2]|uniref:Mechanosensitive ion channel family protein n=1 Tax=Paenibacillus mangrovi TaxID=2931978 RepID=A0A9X1WW49_9BACL|nr:mechanosensitive ion channel family protein [Paenibacillus mangrovi]
MINPYWLEAGSVGIEGTVEKAVKFSDQIWSWLTDVDKWMNLISSGIRIIVLFIVTRIIIRVVSKIIDRTLSQREQSRINTNPRRFATVGELLKNVTAVTCNFIMVLLILSEFHFDLGPLLASAGVLGLAIGFGAQSLVKDVITGFFIILEDQFAVGDVIQTGTYKGTVELIGLRTTRIVSMNGETYILPNGLITSVTNYSISNAVAMVDLPIKSERLLEDTVRLVKEALAGLQEREGSILAVPDVLGIQSMTTSEYVIRVVAQCEPNTRSQVERTILENIKQAMEFEEMQKESLSELSVAEGGE